MIFFQPFQYNQGQSTEHFTTLQSPRQSRIKTNLNRRLFLSLTGTVGLLGVSGTAGATGPITGAPVPNADTTYATVGTNPDAPLATLLGNFKCPFTKDFVEHELGDVTSFDVVSGDENIDIRIAGSKYAPDDF